LARACLCAEPYTNPANRAKNPDPDGEKVFNIFTGPRLQDWGCNCHFGWAYKLASQCRQGQRCKLECGRSSGVEHNLAKVRVVSSNLIARSKKYNGRKAGC